LERATYSVAMLPSAPGLFWTTIVRFISGRILSAKYRTMMSAPLPAANPQMKFTSCDG
jgi:hypothetical protein